jgi:DNA-binding SARP family transcriptional activator
MQGQDKITYHQQVTYCGKPRCRKCREGIGHGPYWYAYQIVNGQTTRTYIGKRLPPDALAAMDVEPTNTGDPAMSGNALLSTPPPLDVPWLRVFTLGQFRLERSSFTNSAANSKPDASSSAPQWHVVTESAWQQRQDSQVRALLGYLLCSPHRRAHRSQLQAALWPTDDNETSTKRLNKTIQSLQRILGHGSGGAGHSFIEANKTGSQAPGAERSQGTSPILQPLQHDDDWLVLAGQERIWVDADVFEEMLQGSTPSIGIFDEELTGHTGSRNTQEIQYGLQTSQQREQLLQTALALYNGDFLPEERDAEWVLLRRQTLRHAWIAAVLELTDIYTARGALADAVKLLDRLLAKDPTNEAAVQRLMLVLARSMRRIEALRAYQRFENILHSEYNAKPSQKTLELCEALRQGKELPALEQAVRLSDPVSQQAPVGLFPEESKLLSYDTDHITDQTVPAASQSTPMDVMPRAGFHLFSVGAPAEAIGRTHQSPLIGREQEMQCFRNLLLEVEQGVRLQLVNQRQVSGIPLDTQRYPQCLFLMGEAGIGKTRLAEEMSREARKKDWAVVWSHIYPQESSIPYRLWIDALRKILDFGSSILPTIDPNVLRPLANLLPEITELLPTSVRDQVMFNPILDASSLKDAICNLLKTISNSIPLVIVLDDIQWADTDSQLLLGFLARLVYGYPIVFLGTCRDTEIPKNPSHPLRSIIAHMQRERAIKTLEVAPLTPEQIGKLVSHVSHLPDNLIQNIQEKAAGNPYFAEELARSTPPALPDTVRAALDHRIRRLSRDCQQLLKNAAVLGGTFEFSLICAMEAGGSAGVGDSMADEDTVLTLLEEALQAGVLTDEGTGTRIFYHFWHPLLVDSLYESVSGLRRARLHLKTAAVLQRMNRGREEEVAATIADHLRRGDAEPVRIAHFSELAGNRAYTIFAYHDAVHHYRQAVDCLLSVNEQEHQERLHFLLEQIAECTSVQGNYAEARDLYEQALELHRQKQARLQDSAEQAYEAQLQALLLIEIGLNWRYTGDRDRAWEYCRRSEEILREAGISTGHAWSRLYYMQSNLQRLDGRFDEALATSQKALELFVQQPEQKRLKADKISPLIQRTLSGNPINLGRIHRQIGAVAQSRGQLTLALEHQSKALSVFEQYDDKRQIAHVSCNIGYIHIKKAEYDLAHKALLRAFDLAERIGDAPLVALVIANLGELVASIGEFGEAEERYRDALKRAESTENPDREYVCRWNVGLGEVLQKYDKLAEATNALCRAWQIARELDSQPCMALVLVGMGNLRIAQATAFGDNLDAPGYEGKEALMRQRLLAHARIDLQRALKLERLERETHTRALLALAQVSLLEHKQEEAEALLAQVRAEARRYELVQVEMQANKLGWTS